MEFKTIKLDSEISKTLDELCVEIKEPTKKRFYETINVGDKIMKVEIKDRNLEIEQLRMVLNMVGIGVDYEHTNLINECFNGLKKKGGSFNIKDAVEIESNWAKKWDDYFTEKELKTKEE